MQHQNEIRFKVPAGPPTIEFDGSVMAWYVRFGTAKVTKTKCVRSPGAGICTLDLNSKNQVVGVELLGIREFTIRAFRALTEIDSSKVDFERAKFLPASARDAVPA
jgi:hypothetical protein